jgi:hypothetical protein
VSGRAAGFGVVSDPEGRPHYRYCASLRLRHPTQDPHVWTDVLAMQPTVIDVVGEPRIRGRTVRSPAKSSFWAHEMEVRKAADDIDDYFDDIATRLADKKAFFDDLVASGGEAELFIGFFLERSNTGFVLPWQLHARLAELHLDLSFDIYDYNREDDAPPIPEPATS